MMGGFHGCVLKAGDFFRDRPLDEKGSLGVKLLLVICLPEAWTEMLETALHVGLKEAACAAAMWQPTRKQAEDRCFVDGTTCR